DEHAWSNMNDNPKRRAWAGLTFEQLCKDHINEIKQKLGISGVLSETSTWYIKGSQSDMEDSKGAQIDMVIDRRDHVVNLCEIKFSVNEFEIDKNYDMAIRNKIEAFNHNTNCRKTIQVTMITTYGIKNNKYRGIVGKEVVLDDLFHSI
ncbi:MAG: ATP-binding protein, partial [Lachnospiraceae bacterium]|nr:ATP-binding protein [Lachnospiraceae bacterium]